MRWKGERESDNIEDRRGMSGGKMMAGGGLGVIVVALIVMALGGDPSQLLSGLQQAPSQQQGEYVETPEEKEKADFIRVVLASTEDVWSQEFKKRGATYTPPKLVLFSGQVQSACGFASAAVGPFYCGEDQRAYIDLAFFEELKTKFGAPGEFAQAYVIAHEVGHHIQNLAGTLDKVHSARGRLSQTEFNKLSVRLELQADFYAGLWAKKADEMRDILDPADIDDALNAANQIGDDTLQREMQGHVVPDSFTHGSAEQRKRWFKKGWDSGRMADGDTFNARNL